MKREEEGKEVGCRPVNMRQDYKCYLWLRGTREGEIVLPWE